MILIEEIERFRKRLPKIKEISVVTPLMGGGVDPAYEFMGEMVLVRKIIEKINIADPQASRFPQIQRNIKCKSNNKVEMLSIQQFVGRIIHASYIQKTDAELAVTNDLGNHFTVSSKEFMFILESLCLGEGDTIIAMCEFFRVHVKKLQEVCKKNSASNEDSEKHMQIIMQKSTNFSFWLIDTYCNKERLRNKILESFFLIGK